MRTCPRCGASQSEEASFCPYDGARLEAGTGHGGDPLLGGLVDGRYRVLTFLGAGGMARVYLVRHVALDRDVALKVLAPELVRDDKLVARFAREARSASAIDHDNVVGVFDFGRDGDSMYLVMEYVPGRGLDAEILRNGAFPAERSAHVLSQIAAGAARAHELGIVHRDLKPENVMLCQRGSDQDFVKILDFGLCMPLADARITGPLELFGTPEYMAPERWTNAKPDVRSDVYALGVIGYELITGALPFTGNVAGLMYKHLEVAPPPIRLPSANAALVDVAMRCLEKDPERRFATMQEVLRALDAVWASLPRQTRRTTYTARTLRRRNDPNELSDPTVYDSRSVDPVWDGPALVEELRRLHGLRRRYLDEIAQALWGERPPTTLTPLLSSLTMGDAAIDRTMEEIAIVEASLEESARAAREQEAQLRLELIDANLALTVFDEGSEEDVDTEVTSRKEMLESPAEPEDQRARQRGAERRLASLFRRAALEQLELRSQLSNHLAAVCRLESELAPIVDELSAIVQSAVRARPDLRFALKTFLTIEGALVSYQGLLDALSEQSA